MACTSDRREGIKCGRLIIYVTDAIVFEKGAESALIRTDVTTTKIRLNKANRITLDNVYVPPYNSKDQEISFIPDNIPTPKNSIVIGDFNAQI